MSPPFSPPSVVVGLDIGTTKICALVAGEGEVGAEGAPHDHSMRVLGVGIVPSIGVRRGVVVDVPDTVEAIKEAVARAAHMAGVEIEGVVAGVTGDHITSQTCTGSVTVASRGNQVSAFDVDRALSAALLEVGRDREIIHSLPKAWSVDEERDIKKPLGMVGTRLEVETHVITGQSAILRNTLSCLGGAGVRADALMLEPLASAEAITTRAEREMGALVLDIGGGTTDMAVYHEGSIVFVAALPVGGNHVTRDVSIGLSTPFEFAEKLKVGSGAATRDMIPHGEALEVFSAGGAARLRIPRALLGEIIEARMRELFELCLALATQNGLTGLVAGGVVLSGGGALLPGSVELAEEIFGLPARLGVPEGLSGWSEAVSSPQFSTAVGLCRVALAQKREVRPKAGAPVALPGARRVWGLLAPGLVMARPQQAGAIPAVPEEAVPDKAKASAKPIAREEFPAQMRFSPPPTPDASETPVVAPDANLNGAAPPVPAPAEDDPLVPRTRFRNILGRTATPTAATPTAATPTAATPTAATPTAAPPLSRWQRFLKFVGFGEEE